jgi:hypothetical protein
MTQNIDLREALFNDRRVGSAREIQMPREAVTRLHGLVVDLDADVLKPNPWFSPADDAEGFYQAVGPVLDRHPILRHAEVRDTGRWLHAVVLFKEVVELKTAKDQDRWTNIHKVLKSSVPADPAAPTLNALTRPIGSSNSKTGRAVRLLRPAAMIPSSALTEWCEAVRRRPFQTIGGVLFGHERLTPCPYCGSEGSYFDLGEIVGFCYGPCQQVPLTRLHAPFLRAPISAAAKGAVDPTGVENAERQNAEEEGKTSAAAPLVITTEGGAVLKLDADAVREIVIRLKRPTGRKKS